MKDKELKELTDIQLDDLWKYYKIRVKYLSKEEYKYLIEIEREMNKRLKKS